MTRALADFWASGGQSSQKWEIPCLGRRAKFDAASFILAGEIRNCTKTKLQTVTDIHTLLISMCG